MKRRHKRFGDRDLVVPQRRVKMETHLPEEQNQRKKIPKQKVHERNFKNLEKNMQQKINFNIFWPQNICFMKIDTFLCL